jgi:hypothetical protein
MVKYVLRKTLSKHSDSINALAFTHDGSLFASGADDGLIVVFKGNGHGDEVRRFQMKAPITALLWHSRFGYTIIAGDACGDVHTICLNNSTNVSASRLRAYMDINDISFIEKCVLPYFQQRLWPCPQHCAKWYIASHWLRERCGANQTRNYGFVFLSTFLMTLGDKYDGQLPGRSSPGFQTHPNFQNWKESCQNLWHDRFTS